MANVTVKVKHLSFRLCGITSRYYPVTDPETGKRALHHDKTVSFKLVEETPLQYFIRTRLSIGELLHKIDYKLNKFTREVPYFHGFDSVEAYLEASRQ